MQNAAVTTGMPQKNTLAVTDEIELCPLCFCVFCGEIPQLTNGCFIDTQHAAVGIERGHYAQRQSDIPNRAVAAGKSKHYGHAKICRAAGQYILNTIALVGVLYAIDHLAK